MAFVTVALHGCDRKRNSGIVQICRRKTQSRPILCKTPCYPSAFPLLTIGHLIAFHGFITFAWCGHLGDQSSPIRIVIFAIWGTAFFDNVLQLPGNCAGHGHFSEAMPKTSQKVITPNIFAVFSVFYLKEPLTRNHFASFGIITLGAFSIFHK